jgi:hypothetical protein
LAPAQGGKIRVAPPPLNTLAVEGSEGIFTVVITLSSDSIGPELHEIKTSDTLPFLSSTTVVTYPQTPQTRFELATPGETKYFQLRSRYYTSDFNKPVVTSAAVESGTVTPGEHHGTHEDGGDDEINVTNLEGLLADEQDPRWARILAVMGS